MQIRWTDLNLSSLKYFVDSVELNSLTQAAELNHVTRPAISQAILRLENQLGYSLLEHKKKHFTLTREGHSFFLKAQEVIEHLNKAFNEISRGEDDFNVACSATVAEYIVIPFLQKIKSFQNVNIRIGTTAKVRQLVSDGEAALGIMIDDGQTFGFEMAELRRGEFEFQSASGKLEYPLITTEFRPEVILGLKVMPELVSPFQVESWSVGRKMAEVMKGTCLVPDLIPRKNFKKINIKKFKYEYKVVAITKNKNHLSVTERSFFEGKEIIVYK